MSALPQPSFQRSEILETVQTFNAIIETQRFLTPAELRLALILIKRGAHREHVSVSAKNWQDWTGLDPKSRELAIRGLQKKCFHTEGRGDKARFRFRIDEWRQYCRTADRAIRPRVEQKRTPAKPGQMIHPECRERGCAMARAAEDNLVSIRAGSSSMASVVDEIDAELNWKPVSDFQTSAADSRAAITQEALCPGPQKTTNSTTTIPTTKATSAQNAAQLNPKNTTQTVQSVKTKNSTTKTTSTTTNPTTKANVSNCKSPSPATPNRKPVSNSAGYSPAENSNGKGDSQDNLEQSPREQEGRVKTNASVLEPTPALPEYWPKTMTAMAQRYLTAGADFLIKLVAAVRKKAADIEDDELSRAVAGVSANTKNQRSPALWLHTVPAAVEVVRREQAKAGRFQE
jgi:hypothetical protein